MKMGLFMEIHSFLHSQFLVVSLRPNILTHKEQGALIHQSTHCSSSGL